MSKTFILVRTKSSLITRTPTKTEREEAKDTKLCYDILVTKQARLQQELDQVKRKIAACPHPLYINQVVRVGTDRYRLTKCYVCGKVYTIT